MRFLIPLLIAAPSLALAEDREVPSPRNMTLTSGLICDTVEQVQQQLTDIALKGDNTDLVEGCGFLRGSMPAIVTPLEWYETPHVFALIAKYDNPYNGYTQFGWIAVDLKDDVTPEPAGQRL